MADSRSTLLVLLACAGLLLEGCAGLQRREPVEVTVVGIEPLQGAGLELRMLLQLRVQNPNDSALDYNGVSLTMDVQGKRFATGVSDATGTVPRFGEAIVSVPVSISVLRIARHAVGAMNSEFPEKLTYEMKGKLAASAFNSAHFKASGELTMPSEVKGSPPPPR